MIVRTHKLCFEQNKKNIEFFSDENFHFLQLRKNMYVIWACFRNDKFCIIMQLQTN